MVQLQIKQNKKAPLNNLVSNLNCIVLWPAQEENIYLYKKSVSLNSNDGFEYQTRPL